MCHVLFPGWAKGFYFSPKPPDRLWGPTQPPIELTLEYFSSGKASGTWSWPLDLLLNLSTSGSTPLLPLYALVTYRSSLTFILGYVWSRNDWADLINVSVVCGCWPGGLWRRIAAAGLLGLWVRIPPREHGCMSRVSVVCCEVEVSAWGWSLV